MSKIYDCIDDKLISIITSNFPKCYGPYKEITLIKYGSFSKEVVVYFTEHTKDDYTIFPLKDYLKKLDKDDDYIFDIIRDEFKEYFV